MLYNFDKIKSHYQILTPYIMQAYARKHCRWTDPYSPHIDWPSMFTPIEMATWGCLRSFGRAPMYPQYPVGRYFADFGHPGAKIALECDGKQWHQDKAKDLYRDMEFKKMGWIVYRISGADCNRIYEQFEELRESNDYTPEEKYNILYEYFTTTVDGLIRAIAIFHFGFISYMHYDEIQIAYKCLKERISINDEVLDELFHEKMFDREFEPF